ncbi:MAG: DNA-directed RNA polymerase [Candidatus Helarchaeota archaeon]|nr:DNA-directed RNA polymerase [Candidatus Helarchaeota archaeon]
MFKLITVRDIVRIPPNRFGGDLNEVAAEILKLEYEEKITPNLGFIIAVVDVIDVGIGKLLPGNGASFNHVTFRVLTFKPDMYEIVEGEVVEIVEFGLFVRLGPLDGLIHVSQVTDDYISFDIKKGTLLAKETGRVIMEGDKVRARIVAVSIGTGGSRSGKLGLTMRAPYLGKTEWIQDKILGIEPERKPKEDKGDKRRPPKESKRKRKRRR